MVERAALDRVIGVRVPVSQLLRGIVEFTKKSVVNVIVNKLIVFNIS